MITELDYALNCAAVEIDTTNARAELAALRAEVTRLKLALYDVDEPGLSTLAQDLRELAEIIDPDEPLWIKWCYAQAKVIDAALADHPAPEVTA